MKNCRDILKSFIWIVSYNVLFCSDTNNFHGWPITIIKVQKSTVFNVITSYINNDKILKTI